MSPHRKSLGEQIADQEDWIAEHGGSLAGYVERYGSGDDPCTMATAGKRSMPPIG
jgi:hypothetical protein